MAALFARRERDGLSLRELSEKSGIPLGTLSWWSWQLRQQPAKPVRAARTAKKRGFVEVVATAKSSREVVVRLGSNVEIEMPAGTDVTWLRDLIAALRPC